MDNNKQTKPNFLTFTGIANPMPHIYSGTRLEIYWEPIFAARKYMEEDKFWELCDFIAFNSATYYLSEFFEYEDIVDYLMENNLYGLIEPCGFGISCGNKFMCVDDSPLEERPHKRIAFEAQSETVMQAASTEVTPVAQTTGFQDEQMGGLYDLHPKVTDSTYSHSDEQGSGSLSGFLSRVVPICTVNWAIATNVDEVCFPWLEFLQDPAIIRKIDNYMLFRADGLKLHFKINGSPFHYGRAYAAFTPTQFENMEPQNLSPHSTAVPIRGVEGTADMTLPKCLYSQQPGIYLDPSTNQPQEFVLPFFFPNNYVDLRYSDQLKRLGTLRIFDLVNLKHANSGTERVTIQVFASLINPVLSMPYDQLSFAGQSLSWEAQAKKNKGSNRSGNTIAKKAPTTSSSGSSGNDEYGNGIISAPASAVEKYMGYLEAVPFIGPYANATKIGASAVGKIASMFGFSRPTIIDVPRPVKPRGWGLMANTEGTDTIPKLSLDPKQELCVDPATVGLENEDQMSLAHLFRRESLVAIQTWNTGNDPGELLCAWKVHPMFFPCGVSGSNDVLAPSALGWAAMPFTHWRGSIEYRIMIVASQMHRGRLAIQWSPTVDNQNTVDNWNTDLTTTKYYTEIIDLTEGRDYTFCVNYAQPVPFLETQFDPQGVWLATSTAQDLTTQDFHRCNGIVSVRVVTELGGPSDTEFIQFCVFARGGKDFMVRNPSDEIISLYSYEEPYSDAAWSAESFSWSAQSADYVAEEENAPMQEHVIVLNGDSPGCNADEISSVFYGEQIVSTRNLIKRYSVLTSRLLDAGSDNATNIFYIRCNNLPPRPGTGDFNINYPMDLVLTDAYSFVQWTFLRYYFTGFAGYRGGVKWKIIPYLRGQNKGANHFVRRDTRFRSGAAGTTDAIFREQSLTQNITANAWRVQQYDPLFSNTTAGFASMSGSDLSYHDISGGIEFEVPFQSTQRFIYTNEDQMAVADRDDPTKGNSYAFSDWQRHGWEYITRSYMHINSNPARFPYELSCAAGEDFSLFFFINAPLMYSRDGPTSTALVEELEVLA